MITILFSARAWSFVPRLFTYTNISKNLNLGQHAKLLTPWTGLFRLTIGADAAKPPFDRVSLALYSLLCRFWSVKFSFLFGNHVVVWMNWISIKPIAGPPASNDTKGLASTRARGSSKRTNCQLQMRIPASTEGPSREQESESACFLCVSARLMSSEQQLLGLPVNGTANPNRPALGGTSSQSPVCIVRRASQIISHDICCQFAAAPHPGSHVAKLNGRRDSSQGKQSRGGRKKNDRIMHRQHTMTFPLPEQFPTCQNSLLLLDRSHPENTVLNVSNGPISTGAPTPQEFRHHVPLRAVAALDQPQLIIQRLRAEHMKGPAFIHRAERKIKSLCRFLSPHPQQHGVQIDANCDVCLTFSQHARTPTPR